MISKDMKIIDLVNEYPEAITILQENGVGCMGCMLAHSETIGEGLTAHGLDVDKILKDIEAATKSAA
ncbi:MAG: disulfide oxidoreductase [Candidatus Margulisbacteria bacterium GWF2_35_9]|nr:MAG: disulfide oxidoreductase [Candidatus Margulisbacteria bacterium GWF2_35_9]